MSGDGYSARPEAAPFDGIIVTCSPNDVPSPLIGQLREGDRMVIPLEEGFGQTLLVLQKEGRELRKLETLPGRFVPMSGQAAAG